MSGPSAATIKRLFALSGNRCAFPGCTTPLFDQNGAFIADVCHIAGNKPGAMRFDPLQTDEQRQGFNNLIVLCANHHRVVDSDETIYTRPALRRMKWAHEAKATEEFVISDRQAQAIASFLGGALVGSALSEMVRGVAEVVGAIKGAVPNLESKPQETKREAPSGLVEALRYAPKGAFQVWSADERHQRLGEFFAGVFKAAGWRLIGVGEVGSSSPPSKPPLVMVFILPDQYQISNAQKAIWEVFDACGFRRDGAEGALRETANEVLRVGIVMATQGPGKRGV